MKRKVSFYYLSLNQRNDWEKSKNHHDRTLSKLEVEEQFAKIYHGFTVKLGNGNRAISVKTPHNEYVVEIMHFENHRAFVKIGQQNARNIVALRDQKTLETENVPMRETQLLELFTFCLIDFETGIVSYIGINGAPKISAIRHLFDNLLDKQEEIYCTLAAIVTHDIVETIKRKSIISQITVSVAIPSDIVLSQEIHVGRAVFDDLRNVKTREMDFKITANRNKNILDSSSQLGGLLGKIKESFGDTLKTVKASARNSDESSQVYDLLEYSFTKSVTIHTENFIEYGEESFRTVLENVYSNNRRELIRYTPTAQ